MAQSFNDQLKSNNAKEIREYFENILALMPGHVYWKNVDGVILGCNEQQAKSAGFNSINEMIGKTDYQMPWHAQADRLREIDCQVMQTGKTFSVEEESTLADGTKAIFLSKKVPLYNNKQIIGILGISLDITDRKLAEEREKIAIQKASEEKANAEAEANLRTAVTVFAGSIAHDLRVPLTSMSVIIDLFTKFRVTFISEHEQLIAPANADMMRMHLESIDSFPIKMRKIIRDMNEFIDVTLKSMQHLIAGTLSYEDFTISEIEHAIADAVASYPYKNNEKKLIHINIDYNFEFLGYPVLFYRIIFNLISNSLAQIEKNKKGEIYITTEENEKFNLLHYKDTAGGVPQKIVAQLFDGYKTTKKSGTGVGLAFCKLTMQSFNGDIICHSVEGRYIEFTLSFPKLSNKDQ